MLSAEVLESLLNKRAAAPIILAHPHHPEDPDVDYDVTISVRTPYNCDHEDTICSICVPDWQTDWQLIGNVEAVMLLRAFLPDVI